MISAIHISHSPDLVYLCKYIYFDSIYSDSVLQKVGLGRASDRVNASHTALRLQLAVFGWSPDNNTSTLESLQNSEHITWPMILKFPPQIGRWPTNKKAEFLNPLHWLVGRSQMQRGNFKADRSRDKLDTLQGFYSLSLVLLVPYVRALIPWVLQPPLVLAPPVLSWTLSLTTAFLNKAWRLIF